MEFLHSKKFLNLWGIWTLILGISLAFFSLFQEIHSFSEYLNAFLAFDMPNSWCPTFLTLYGLSSLLGNKLIPLTRFLGLVLLPMGIYTLYSYTFMPETDPLPIYIYAQTIHITELLTGLLTIYLLARKNG